MAQVFALSEILNAFSSSSVYHKLIDEIKRGFINYSNKVVYVAPVVHLGSNDNNSSIPQMIGKGDVCLKSGYIVHDKYYVIKIAGGGFKNERNENYPNSGAMLVFSQLTGALNGILMDHGVLTGNSYNLYIHSISTSTQSLNCTKYAELRTAAASALASKYFAPKSITNIGIVGTGVQGRYQLDMLQHIIPFKTNDNINIFVYGRNSGKRNKFKKDMMKKGIYCQMTNNMYDIGRNCNLIIMCTAARESVLKVEHLMDKNGNLLYKENGGLHINCIGADTFGKQELDQKIISKYVDLIMVDSKQQCFEFGEVQHVVKNKTISNEKVIEFGVALNENNLKKLSRKNKNDARLTLFDSTGVAVQDVVIAKMVYESLNGSINSKL